MIKVEQTIRTYPTGLGSSEDLRDSREAVIFQFTNKWEYNQFVHLTVFF